MNLTEGQNLVDGRLRTELQNSLHHCRPPRLRATPAMESFSSRSQHMEAIPAKKKKISEEKWVSKIGAPLPCHPLAESCCTSPACQPETRQQDRVLFLSEQPSHQVGDGNRGAECCPPPKPLAIYKSETELVLWYQQRMGSN